MLLHGRGRSRKNIDGLGPPVAYAGESHPVYKRIPIYTYRTQGPDPTQAHDKLKDHNPEVVIQGANRLLDQTGHQ